MNRVEAMAWEDRVRLVRLLHDAGKNERAVARLDSLWRDVIPAGRRLQLPENASSPAAFTSRVRPIAQLLRATLAVSPKHPQVGALVESLMQRDRADRIRWWNSQDYAYAADAVVALASTYPQGDAVVDIESTNGKSSIVGQLTGSPRLVREKSWALGDLAVAEGDSVAVSLRLTVRGAPAFWPLSAEDVPVSRPVTPDVRGIIVERWYERFDDGRTVTEVKEGELVRVRLRVTVPGDREFVAVEDPIPAGLEAVDLSLRTSATLGPFVTAQSEASEGARDADTRTTSAWSSAFGSWDYGWWTPWEHQEMRDDRVVWFARSLWKGTYTASYVARATTAGRFVRPPAHAEEMYNPALNGRSDGGWFTVISIKP
jgi:alpha-2-macroglobulin